MLGHSMGSFLIRQYMEMYGDRLSGVIVMGTGSQPEIALKAGKFICRILAAFRGWHYRSAFIDRMAFGSYNKQFEPARTGNDWLTKDEKLVDLYRSDPWCTFRFTVNAYYHMFRGIQYIQKKENIAKIPKDLPLFFVAGAEDPVGNNGKSVTEIYNTYKTAGIHDIQIKLYENDRHEILNETDRDVVYSGLQTWLDSKCL